MGDFLYSRALSELVRLGDMEPLAVFTNASNALTLGEMRQLAALDALAFSEDDYDTLIESKTASLFAAACEVGSLVRRAAVPRGTHAIWPAPGHGVPGRGRPARLHRGAGDDREANRPRPS